MPSSQRLSGSGIDVTDEANHGCSSSAWYHKLPQQLHVVHKQNTYTCFCTAPESGMTAQLCDPQAETDLESAQVTSLFCQV